MQCIVTKRDAVGAKSKHQPAAARPHIDSGLAEFLPRREITAQKFPKVLQRGQKIESFDLQKIALGWAKNAFLIVSRKEHS